MNNTNLNLELSADDAAYISEMTETINHVTSGFKNLIGELLLEDPKAFDFDVNHFLKIKDPQDAFQFVLGHPDLMREYVLFTLHGLSCFRGMAKEQSPEESKN